MEPKVRLVSHYEILEQLGAGGMGVVFKAHDLKLDRIVAIKFLPSRLATNELQKDRFIKEARAASSLDHPNICTIHEIGSVPDGQIFIAMAYYEGETLKQKLARGRLGLAESVDIAIQVAQGLAKAHAKGIIHRDIKPANLVITNDGLVKILDFGVAKLSGVAHTVTEPGTLVGTVAYMSPEQTAGETDLRTDLWSLGVVLYEMVTGQHPFYTDRERTTIYQILHHQPSSVTGLRPEVPVALERVIARMLEKDPALRYPRAEDLVEDLRLARPRSSQEPTYSTGPSSTRLTSELHSIVVLPFANLSHESEAEYFGDGLAEELIYALSRVKGLRVVSRVSAFEFRGKSQNLSQIAQRLNVNSVLTGSVRLASGRLRVNVELTNIADSYCLWSNRYDREMKDVFAIQDEIASNVVNALRLRLVDQHSATIAQHYVAHPDAYKLYLTGRYCFNKHTEQGFQKAGECFRQAIIVDPSCAPAYAGLADTYLAMGLWSVIAPKEAWPQAREYATKAIQVDSSRPEPHIALAKIYQFGDWNRGAAEAEFRQAIQLNPGLSEAHFAYSVFLFQTGLLDQALDEVKRAHDLDPLNLTVGTGVAWIFYYLGDYQRALEQCRQVLELSPDYFEAQGCMALCSEKIGAPGDHVAWLEKAAAGGGVLPFVLGLLGRAYALNGQRDKALEIQAELQMLSEKRYTSPAARALVSIGLGELDRAMAWLEEALQAHDAFLCYAKIFPPYDPLRGQTRFQEILQRMGLLDPAVSESSVTITLNQDTARLGS